MTPITHRNREIERLERELVESREECRRLQHRNEILNTIVGLYYDSPKVLYACGMDSEEYEVWREIAKPIKQKIDEFIATLAPKAGDK